MQTTTTTRNPFQPRRFDGSQYDVIDTRNGDVVDCVEGFDAAQIRCAALLREEGNRALALIADLPAPSAAEIAAAVAADEALNGLGEPMPADADEALARQLYGEVLALIAADEVERRGEKVGQLHRLGYAVCKRAGEWSLVRVDGGAGVVVATPALFARPSVATTVATLATMSAEHAALYGILYRRAEQAGQAAELARTDGDRESEKIARNSVAAYTKARALLAQAGVEFVGRPYLITPSGDLLVRSATRAGQWHAVSRRPIGADGYSPICCACEHGTRGGFGICLHVGIFEAYEELCDTEAEIAARATLAAA